MLIAMTDFDSPLWRLSLAGSEIAAARIEAGALVLRLSAAAVRRVVDGVAGYLRPVELRLAQARCEGGEPADLFGGVRAARVLQAGRVLDALPLPGRLDGALVLELQLIHGTALRIEAGALVLALPADASPVFHESCDC
ncbi:MAG: hypothetical protein QG612_214 [Pseudomonadota bacterium]|nr:hypothetical protein [Pseudomonadota bacterium]